jgi:hypothetical protein
MTGLGTGTYTRVGKKSGRWQSFTWSQYSHVRVNEKLFGIE